MYGDELDRLGEVGFFSPRSLKHFLEIELMTARRALEIFGGLKPAGTADPEVQEEVERISGIVVQDALRRLDEYQLALDFLNEGNRQLAVFLLEQQIISLAKQIHRSLLGGYYETARRIQGRVEELERIRSKTD